MPGGGGDGGMGLRPALGTERAQAAISSAGAALCRGGVDAGASKGRTACSYLRDPEQFRSPPRSRSDEGKLRQQDETTVSKLRPIGPQAPGFPGGNDSSRPKLGRHGRREIGRALEAMYEDVVKQGVPPRILQLLEGLDARAGGARKSPTA
jgi:anti-sigma factor NepR-like protein